MFHHILANVYVAIGMEKREELFLLMLPCLCSEAITY